MIELQMVFRPLVAHRLRFAVFFAPAAIACAFGLVRTPDLFLLEKSPAANVGVDYARHGLWDRAVEAWRSAQQTNPSDPSVLYNLGVASERANALEEAIRLYSAALNITPRSHYMHALSRARDKAQSQIISEAVNAGSTAVRIRARPDLKSEVLGSLSRGERLPVSGRSGAWIRVQRADGTAGWIYGQLVKLVPRGAAVPTARAGSTGMSSGRGAATASAKPAGADQQVASSTVSTKNEPAPPVAAAGPSAVQVSVQSARVFTEADDWSAEIATLEKGTIVDAMERGARFVKVRLSSGRVGYVRRTEVTDVRGSRR